MFQWLQFPWDIAKKAFDIGLLNTAIPPQYGKDIPFLK